MAPSSASGGEPRQALAAGVGAYLLWGFLPLYFHVLYGMALLLLAAGPATVVPLALFAWAARRLTMTALGFLQFLAPTLQFGVGIALGEAFTPLRALSFAFIWAGVAVFAFGVVRASRQRAA